LFSFVQRNQSLPEGKSAIAVGLGTGRPMKAKPGNQHAIFFDRGKKTDRA
jgi:hypothetical protein